MISRNKLSYIDSLYLQEQAAQLVTGLKKSLSFYYDAFEKKIVASVLEQDNNQIENLELDDDFDLIQIMRLRSNKQNVSWLQESELPFNLKRNHNIQRKVFDELDNIILLMRFPNKDDGKMDLIYLFLNADASNFGLRKASDILKTENKSIVGQLIYNSFKQILAQRKTFVQKYDKLKDNYALMQAKLEAEKTKHKTLKQDYQKQLLNYCQYLIEKHSTNLGLHIEIGRELLELLSNFKGSIQNLEQLIADAIERANAVNMDLLSPVLNLEEWHFDNLDQDIYEPLSRSDELSPDSRYINTYRILDRYEESARKLVSNREKLTGANVGKALPSPISAAAVTDSLKKHQSKIKTLCKQYPNRWKIIRNEFRPLTNILGA